MNVKFEGMIKEVLKKEFDKKEKVFQKIRLDSGVLVRCYKTDGLEVGRHFSGECQELDINSPDGTKIKLYFCQNPVLSGDGASNSQISNIKEGTKTNYTQTGGTNTPQSEKTAKERQIMIIRQNCLAHGVEYAKIMYEGNTTITGTQIKDAVKDFAEFCEKWVLRETELDKTEEIPFGEPEAK